MARLSPGRPAPASSPPPGTQRCFDRFVITNNLPHKFDGYLLSLTARPAFVGPLRHRTVAIDLDGVIEHLDAD
jgi:hypothetical protein